MSSSVTPELLPHLPPDSNPSPLSPTKTPDAAHAGLDLHIHHTSTLRNNAKLAEEIRLFANEGYKYMAEEIKPRWDYLYGERLPTPESLFKILGEDGFIAVLYAQKVGNGIIGTPVACAATKRWTGDLEGRKTTTRAYQEEDEDKEGWEVLCVTTHVNFMKRGYAGRCINGLIKELQRQTLCGRASRRRQGKDCESKSEQSVGFDDIHGANDFERGDSDGRNLDCGISRTLTVWTQAVEELNGRFWRNRGWKEVRRYHKPVGSWGSKFGYELLVLIREVEIGAGN